MDYLRDSSDSDCRAEKLEVTLRRMTPHRGQVATGKPLLVGLPAQGILTLRSLVITSEEALLKCFHQSQKPFSIILSVDHQ